MESQTTQAAAAAVEEADLSPRERLARGQAVLQAWVDRQGHDRCWYYPEVFNELCRVLGVTPTVQTCLPPRAEFRSGCMRYEEEQYGEPEGRPLPLVLAGLPWLPRTLSGEFMAWMRQHRRPFFDFLTGRYKEYAPREVSFAKYEGDWLIRWAFVKYADVPEEARWCVWHDFTDQSPTYMYLRSHPDRLGTDREVLPESDPCPNSSPASSASSSA